MVPPPASPSYQWMAASCLPSLAREPGMVASRAFCAACALLAVAGRGWPDPRPPAGWVIVANLDPICAVPHPLQPQFLAARPAQAGAAGAENRCKPAQMRRDLAGKRADFGLHVPPSRP